MDFSPKFVGETSERAMNGWEKWTNSEYILEAEQTAIQYMNGLGWVGKKEKLRLSSTFWDMKNSMSELLYVVKRSRVGGRPRIQF